jgi:NADPH:quinone reductase-like Zn-dependent oxidoreductase
MKAVRYHSYGDSDVLVYEDAGRPVARAGQVVVKVAGTAFNPVDVAIRAGFLQEVAGQQFDAVLNLVRTSPEETARLVGPVANGGAFVSTTTPGPEDAGRGVRTVRMFARSDASQLAELIARVDAGDLRIDVAERRPLTGLAAVHEQAVAGQLAGKTVLIP